MVLEVKCYHYQGSVNSLSVISGLVVSESLPNISGKLYYTNTGHSVIYGVASEYTVQGALSLVKLRGDGAITHVTTSSADRPGGISFNASSSSGVYTTNGKVRPNSLITQFFIKF